MDHFLFIGGILGLLMNITIEQAALLAHLMEEGKREGPDSAAQKEFNDCVRLLSYAMMREFHATGKVEFTIGETEE